MTNNIFNINDLKEKLLYYNEKLKKWENYDILSLTRINKAETFSSLDIFNEWKRIWEEIKFWKTAEKLEMYIHIPFCEEFCDFCVYYKQLLIKDKEIIVEKYIDYLISQMEFYAPAFEWAIFKCLSVWWWTPSILTARQIKKLFWKLFELFTFEEWCYKWIEFRPSSTNEDKLIALKEVWFQTIHFWVQSLDNQVLLNMNRKIDTEIKVKESIYLVKKHNFENIFIHLIRWLKWDTIEKFAYTLDKISSYWVWNILIYWLVTKQNYLKKHFWYWVQDFYSWWYNKFSLDLKEIIPDIAKKHWYILDSNTNLYDHAWALYNPEFIHKEWYGDISSWRINLFSFWPSARSYKEWTIIYEWEKKIKYTFDKYEQIYIGNKLNIRDEMEKIILTWFRDNDKVSISDFYSTFNKDILSEFKKEFLYLKILWVINITKDYIYFLEKDKKRRMLYCMFIINKL